MKFKYLPLKIALKKTILQKMYFSAFLSSVIMAISSVGGGFIDTLIITQNLDMYALSATGLASPFFTVLATFSGCIASGLVLLMTQDLGKGNVESLNKHFSNAFVFTSVFSVQLFFCMFFLLELLIAVFGASADNPLLFTATKQYLSGLLWGIPPLMLNTVITPCLQLDNNGKTVIAGGLCGAFSNILFDLVCVYMGWGIFQIGLATSLSAYVNLLILMTHFFRKENKILKLQFSKLDMKEFFTVVTLGSDKILMRLINIIRPVALNCLMLSVNGTVGIYVLSVNNSIVNILGVMGTGIATATSLLSGIFYGELNADDIQKTGSISHRLIVFCGIAADACLLLFAKPIVQYYVGNVPEAAGLMTFALYCICISFPLSLYSYSRICYLQSTHATTKSKILNFTLNFVFVVGFSYLLTHFFGDKGIFIAFALSEVTVLLEIVLYKTVTAKTFKVSIFDYLSLGQKFILKPQDIIDVDIRSMEDVSLLSEQIMLFCKGHKLDSKKTMYAEICAEEYASTVVQYAMDDFQYSNIEHLRVRIVISEGDILLRFRDSCRTFDITKLLAKMGEKNTENPSAVLGIDVIHKMAVSVQHYRSFGINTTIIRI